MIVSKTVGQRRKALSKLLPMQRGDFEGIYEAMHGLPVTIRYLDPPLHEFLPTSSYDIAQLAKDMNDLTQMTFGFSRDDAGGFLNDYYEKKIFEQDPFARVDQKGVGKLIEMAVAGGRKTRPEIKLGICGEHGGDPSSIDFCHRMGLSYVSCSPFRVPIARLAAAQAAINHKKG